MVSIFSNLSTLLKFYRFRFFSTHEKQSKILLHAKNDLVRRLRIVVKELGDEDVVAHSDEYPGLEGLSALLVDPKFIDHKDKEVRLQTCLACMEIFYLVRIVIE